MQQKLIADKGDCFSRQELISRGFTIADGASPAISRLAAIQISPNKHIRLEGNVAVQGQATIILDEKGADETIIKNSVIQSYARLWNSSIRHTQMQSGSQVIFNVDVSIHPTVEATLSPDEFVLTLQSGSNFDEANFAQTRGGVLKRTSVAIQSKKIVVPTGHSMISENELASRVLTSPENQNRPVPASHVAGNLLVASGYCHPQAFDTLFDPARFTHIEHVQSQPTQSSDIESSTLFWNLHDTPKSKENPEKAQQLLERTNTAQKVVLRLLDGTFLIISR